MKDVELTPTVYTDGGGNPTQVSEELYKVMKHLIKISQQEGKYAHNQHKTIPQAELRQSRSRRVSVDR